MREIKFRAWDGEQMFYTNDDSTIVLNKNGWELGIADYDWDVHEASSRKTNHVLMQFTGLKDKNGKEIYEGDILTTRDSVYYNDEEGLEYSDLLICNNFHKFIYKVLYSEDHGGLWGEAQKDLEVIGNIYKNPELCH